MIFHVNAQLHHWNNFKFYQKETAVEKPSDVSYQLLTSLQDDAPVACYIPASTKEHKDLNNTKFCITYQIVKPIGLC